jgi:hypothetical protein
VEADPVMTMARAKLAQRREDGCNSCPIGQSRVEIDGTTSALQSVISNCDSDPLPCAMPFESVPAEESAGQDQKRFMDVGAFFVANSQPSELVQPSEGSLHHPAPSPQPTAMFGITLRKSRHDAAGTQTFPDRFRVITSVSQHAIRTMARSPPFSL